MVRFASTRYIHLICHVPWLGIDGAFAISRTVIITYVNWAARTRVTGLNGCLVEGTEYPVAIVLWMGGGLRDRVCIWTCR